MAGVPRENESGWQQFIDRNLMPSGALISAAILSAHSGATWAKSQGFPVLSTEVATVLTKDNFMSPSVPHNNHIRVGDQKFMCTHADAYCVCGNGANGGGVILVKTKQCVIVGIYGKTLPRMAVKVVEDLGAYLMTSGY
ncbi:Profilin [Pelomyxa schiedti]|nr:Profilin [Pelomyxa schiedti]